MADDTSRLRQRLRTAHERRGELLNSLLEERMGLIRGTFGTRARVCGHPGCRCASGELHESKYLSAAVQGRARQVHVPAGDEVRVAEGVARYQRWRSSRAEIMVLDSEQHRLLEALGLALLASYPPDNPIPPPGKRGRKREKKARDG